MNKKKIAAILYFIVSLCFYVLAIISFVNKGDLGVVCLCLGSAFLCLGAVFLNKDKDEKDK